MNELIFQNTSDLMLYLDTSGRIVKVNRTGVTLYGVQENEILGNKFWGLPGVFSRDIPEYFEVFKRALRGEITRGFVTFLKDEGGKKRVIDFSLFPITERKEVKYVFVIGKDITKQKETEERYRVIAEYTNDLIALTTFTSDLIFLYASPSHKRVLGVNPSDLVGTSAWDRVHPEDARRLFPLLEKYLRNKEKLISLTNLNVYERFELRIKDKLGNWRYYECVANIVHDKLLFVLRDIDTRKRNEEIIKQQNFQLRKLDELKSAFLSITSHELRTPITAIKGHTQLLLKGMLGSITENQRKTLDTVLKNVNRLDALIQDILDLSRLESGTMKFVLEKTDIKKMVEETIDAMQASAKMKNITIHSEIEKDIPSLFIDERRIKQVLMNIIGNAIKFSPEGSPMNIRVKKEERAVLFEVQDFGCGIPREEQEKIFDAFYQVGGEKKLNGVGLGLSISRAIILSHGGKIWVKSKPGEGSIFAFVLPIKDTRKKVKEIDFPPLKRVNRAPLPKGKKERA